MKAFAVGVAHKTFNGLAVAGWILTTLIVLWFLGVIDLYGPLLWLIGYR